MDRRTDELYRRHGRRAERLIADAGRHRSIEGYAWALGTMTDGVSRQTFRLYRRALDHRVEVVLGTDARLAFLDMCAAIEKPPTRRRKLIRSLPSDVLAAIDAGLAARRTRTAHLARLLLRAMVHLGARPSEWATARIEGRTLVFQNAKFRPHSGDAPGRGNGRVRRLVVDDGDIGDAMLAVASEVIVLVAGRRWSTLGPRVGTAVKEVVAKLVADGTLSRRWLRLRVYDARHQFAADAKATLRLLDGEIAATMGHASIETAVVHYGKRKAASGRSIVRPTRDTVSGVRLDTGRGLRPDPLLDDEQSSPVP